mmetsp:Transcript_12219/g.40918  ORF Transcript_12219/g.40918 Transcript_12219/m.40918 type:complete len:89 (-) Transcript_12219:104-370(-)
MELLVNWKACEFLESRGFRPHEETGEEGFFGPAAKVNRVVEEFVHHLLLTCPVVKTVFSEGWLRVDGVWSELFSDASRRAFPLPPGGS